MTLIEEYNKKYEFFKDITGEAMLVHRKYKHGLLESAYEAALNENIIMELKAVSHVDTGHRKQLWNYMNLTHLRYGMIVNFGAESLYSEWYERDPLSGKIEKIKLM